MPEDTVVVFTAKSAERIAIDGGSGSWVLDPARVNRLDWLVCAQNRANTESYADGTAPHGSAFLIGRVCGTTHVSTDSGKKRYRIDISEYAHIPDQPDIWEGLRNPVHYTSLAKLPIRVDELHFQSVATHGEVSAGLNFGAVLAETKDQLARALQISPASIEIVVRT